MTPDLTPAPRNPAASRAAGRITLAPQPDFANCWLSRRGSQRFRAQGLGRLLEERRSRQRRE
jgi:hypothetical protein